MAVCVNVALLRTYPAMVCALFITRPSRSKDKEQRESADTPISLQMSAARKDKGKNGDTGTHGKHQTKNLKFQVHQQRPARAKIGTLGPMANIRLKM